MHRLDLLDQERAVLLEQAVDAAAELEDEVAGVDVAGDAHFAFVSGRLRLLVPDVGPGALEGTAGAAELAGAGQAAGPEDELDDLADGGADDSFAQILLDRHLRGVFAVFVLAGHRLRVASVL